MKSEEILQNNYQEAPFSQGRYPGVDELLAQGKATLQEGLLEEAETWLKEARQKDPFHAGVHNASVLSIAAKICEKRNSAASSEHWNSIPMIKRSSSTAPKPSRSWAEPRMQLKLWVPSSREIHGTGRCNPSWTGSPDRSQLPCRQPRRTAAMKHMI